MEGEGGKRGSSSCDPLIPRWKEGEGNHDIEGGGDPQMQSWWSKG